MYECLSGAKKKGKSLPENTFRKAMASMHQKGSFGADMLSEKPFVALIEQTNQVFKNALHDGITYEIPAVMKEKLENDIFLFSGCKSYVELKEAASFLYDKEKNQVKSFDDFYKDVVSIDETYNKRYLEAEYYFAVGSSQSAAHWAQIEEDGDDYNLQYRTAGDDKVREEHAALEGTTLPPSDDFWNYYMPPNGWNCRCEAIQVLKDKYERSNSAEAIALGNEATEGKNEIFRFNPGKQEVIFPPHHPYFKVKDQISDVLNNIKKDSETADE
jgi:SPP1 gp7 family putative phage head morphogenesis protein